MDIPQGQELCRSFWTRYQKYHGQHEVFEKYGASEWGSLIPVFVHGDKGRTLQKSPIFVLSWETPFGLPRALLDKCKDDNKTAPRQCSDGRLGWSCGDRMRFSGKRSRSEMESLDRTCTVRNPSALDHLEVGNHQRHNSKGHSYLSRFLVAAVTSKVYKQNSKVLPGLLSETAKQLQELFHEGVEAHGVCFKFVFLGCKGDAEWHWEAAQFTRSYHHSSVKSHIAICPHCAAGEEGVSMTDGSDNPVWAGSLGSVDPWDTLPPLNHAPYSNTFKAGLYKFDPFHVLKFGVFRDAVGSCLIRLCLMTYFDFASEDSLSIESRLERAYSKFRLWCLAERKFPAIKQFSKGNVNFEKFRSFPWVNGKGSDITLIMMFLEFILRCFLLEPPKSPGDEIPLKAMLQLLQGGLNYIGILHSHGIWLPRACAETQVWAGLRFYRGYLYMATFCMEQRVAGFRLRPKIYYFHHLVYELQVQLRSDSEYIFSAATYMCEQNEDFIGRLSRISRRVAARTAGLRSTQRYLVKVRCLLERLCKK